jgi:hypothetical protein
VPCDDLHGFGIDEDGIEKSKLFDGGGYLFHLLFGVDTGVSIVWTQVFWFSIKQF